MIKFGFRNGKKAEVGIQLRITNYEVQI